MDSLESADDDVGWSSGLSLAEQVKAAAEEAVNQSGFVYNEETGLYYDSNTQLYYNSETGLYYNGFTGTWYRYDEALSEYVVHHQIEGFTFENAVAEHVLSSIETYTTELSKKVEAETKPAKEDGEISDDDESENGSKKKKNMCEAHKLAEKLPPCARLLVVSVSESSVSLIYFVAMINITAITNTIFFVQLQPGMLFIVPYTGGIIGRLSECIVHLDDVNVSKNHAKLIYNEDEKSYTIQDLGSRNGTFINSVNKHFLTTIL